MDFEHNEFVQWLKEEYSFTISYIYSKDYNLDEFINEFRISKGL